MIHLNLEKDFDENDSSFTSVSQRPDNTKVAVKMPVQVEVAALKENFLSKLSRFLSL